MKSRLMEGLQILVALLITGSLIFTFEPQQDAKATVQSKNVTQTVSSTAKAPEKPVEASVTPEIKRVDQVPTQQVKPVTEPQNTPQAIPKSVIPPNNEQIVWDNLISQGFSRTHTAAIMGNLKQEHNFQTDGDGLAQWIGGRKVRLMADPNWQDINVQVKFLIHELKDTYSHVYSELLSTTTLEDGVRIFQNRFEICNPRFCMENKRIQYAYDILSRH